jgi:hypothetical protein
MMIETSINFKVGCEYVIVLVRKVDNLAAASRATPLFSNAPVLLYKSVLHT